ncbi:aminotransferase class I/II-fold pyridoxal phosphate-dependent enzyme [Gelidibacter salicanalis]|uniref:Pyridoxal phosphate-dependent aminotransferase family protein n=1 Tax=Gelidibacter salicanalis TaxID=291193 RepID=A0A934KL40_9FLAO|nr:aminotransferase class I/II-fold pyridoxal phosphate-dependent enzyme [Gelidibacter salicanalis]MBJ7879754.1 pyridoxal phosphate-dependent aminotransferase family protein [Gelidibacter salicanalis]
MTIEHFPDRTISVAGETYLYFGGTSYLGMATNPEFQNLLCDSIKIWGTAYGSSRNANIKLSIYKKAEDVLAKIIGADAALTVSSGTLAGKIVIDYLSKDHRKFYHYPKTHPAILKSSSVPLFVEGALHPDLTDTVEEAIVVTADALLSLAVEPTNFDFLNAISPSKRVTLLLDESHSLGVVGSRGDGVFKTVNYPRLVQKIMISSLTKAYSCSGGVIAGNQQLINTIKNDAVFISAAGMNPIFLQTFVEAQELLQDQLQKLRANLQFLFGDTNLPSNFIYDADYPVIYSSSEGIFDYLKSKGIIITNFKYPNYDMLMNRIVITANHTKQDIKQLKSALLAFQ